AYFIGFEGVDIESKTVEIGGKKMPKKDWHNYGFYFYQKYKSFATSENLGKAFTVADHLWLDYIISLLLQVENFPNAKLKESIDQSYYINFSKTKDIPEATRNVTIFLNGLNDFYKEINFDNYFIETKAFYEKVINEVRSGLPKQDFIGAMEDFYENKFDGYVLIPSLTIPKGMGFGLRNTAGKKTRVFNVFGAFDTQEFLTTKELKMGFTNQNRLRELSVHEFGHSFVNPTVDKLPGEIISETERLFEPLKAAMSDQGYNTWKVCIYEHFVRAGEIMIAEKLGDKDGARRLQTEYEQERKFKYIPAILVELKKFDKGIHKTYYDAVLRSMEELVKKVS
ncbi:MAG TPA: DUF4932 domain-containing protein, partial [Chitinophagaceae bacterium]|nr:DUF4932 domain-containing protein [Chitinophagaceae bacterium]